MYSLFAAANILSSNADNLTVYLLLSSDLAIFQLPGRVPSMCRSILSLDLAEPFLADRRYQ